MQKTKTQAFLKDNLDPGVDVTHYGGCNRATWDCLLHFSSDSREVFKAHVEKAREQNVIEAHLMAIGLARLDGDKVAFEDAAVEYATTFDHSPPDWMEEHQSKKTEKVDTVAIQVQSLTMESIIEATMKMENPRPLIIDLGKAAKSDTMGIDMFNESLNGRIERNDPTKINNVDRLVTHYIDQIKKQPAKNHQGIWNFIFNCCKLSGSKKLYDLASKANEEAGGSPPKWENLAHEENQEASKQSQSKGIVLDGKLSTLNDQFARALFKMPEGTKALETKEPMIFDFVNIRQASLADARDIIHFTKVFQGLKVPFEFINVNEIIIEILKAIGIDQVAEKILPPGVNS